MLCEDAAGVPRVEIARARWKPFPSSPARAEALGGAPAPGRALLAAGKFNIDSSVLTETRKMIYAAPEADAKPGTRWVPAVFLLR